MFSHRILRQGKSHKMSVTLFIKNLTLIQQD